MSDPVSDHVLYMAGDTGGRDHIQFPTILRDRIEEVRNGIPLTDDEKDANWPVDVTLAQIMALCWRVRRWDFSGSVNVSVTTRYPNPPAGDIVSTAAGTATVDATEMVTLLNDIEAVRERDLVGKVFDDETNDRTKAYQNLINDGISFVTGNAPVSDWSATGDFGSDSGFRSLAFVALNTFMSYHLFDEDTEKFAPPFGGPGALIAASSTDLIASARFFRNPATVLSGPTPTLLKTPIAMTVIPGIAPSFDVPMELAWRLAAEIPGGTTDGTASGAFTLQATEFWPYAGKFDPGDGHKL